MEPMTVKLLRYSIAGLIFVVIIGAPFVVWTSSASQDLWWVMGLTMVVWLPAFAFLGFIAARMFIASTRPRP